MSTISRLTDQIKQNAKDNFKDFLLNTFLGDAYPQENVLHRYRTFNYNVTLGIVNPTEFKTGSYRTSGLDYIVFQSHGKNLSEMPIIRTGTKLDKVQDFIGALNGLKDNKWDFYLQDLFIKNSFTAKRDIGTEFRLKVVEPYGMDTFIKTILEGLRQKGYADFGKGNAFVLKIEFVGYRDDKEVPEIIPFTTRYYPLIISELKAEVTEQGTVYDIAGVPLNDMGRYNDVNVIPQDFKISGNTVKDVLKGEKGLLKFLNETMAEKTKASGNIPTQYDIVFLDEKGQPTENGGKIVSKILSAKMYDIKTDAGHRAMVAPTNEYIQLSSANDRVLTDNGELIFSIPGKLGIARIIDNIINDSHYVLDKMLNNFQGEFLEDGMVPWWRIVPKVEQIGFDPSKNTPVLKVIFMVAPRRVPWQKLASIFFPDTKAEPEDYERFCTRKYEYNYTGNNRDLLNFRIHYDQLYVKLLSANLGTTAAKPGEMSTAQGTNIEQANFKASEKPNPNVQDNSNNKVAESDRQKSNAIIKSNTDTRPESYVGRDVNALFNNPFENVNIEMEILGDPMWLGTQFIDNISYVDPEKSDLYTTDGGIAMRTIDPCVRVIAYAPSDINVDGYLASNNDQDKKMSQWSAYYMIHEIESTFTGGIFKQKLRGYRLTDTDMKKAAGIASPIDIFGFKKMGAVL
jgi:hypothetical protein